VPDIIICVVNRQTQALHVTLFQMASDTKKYFPGQHDDERVLAMVKQHFLGFIVRITKVGLLVLGVVMLTTILGAYISKVVYLPGVIVGVVVGLIGFWYTYQIQEKSLAYITDRRIVRFDVTTPFSTTSRTLGWDDTIKVKTFAPNIFWKMLNVGKLTVHAKSSMVGVTEAPRSFTTNDDIDLDYVYYYRDLGNYLDKILYLYKNKPKDLSQIHRFVGKPKWHRY